MRKSTLLPLLGKPRPQYEKPSPDFPLFPHATGRWAKKVKGKLIYFGRVADDPHGVAALAKWRQRQADEAAGRAPGRAGPSSNKPSVDFPLFKHQTGRWAKKVRGRLHYFGSVAKDPDGATALNSWLDQRDDLLAGRTPRVKGDGLDVRTLVNHFLTHKESLRDSGELAPRTFDRYLATAERLVTFFGKTRLVNDLAADDFQAFRNALAKRYGAVALGNEIQMVRAVFKYGYEAGLIDKPIRYGPGFKKPSAKAMRQARAANGPRLFTHDEIQKAMKAGTPNTKAMILLGINGALGNTDIGLLPIEVLDLDGGWLNYPRSKTAIPRRIPLWPETVNALRNVLKHRPQPNDRDATGLVFIGPRGESYVGKHRGYRVGNTLAVLFKEAGIEERTFYDLRRTFQTIADGSHDAVAVSSIMGHAPASGDMAAVYRQGVSDARLKAVTDHVRRWLWPRRAGKAKAK